MVREKNDIKREIDIWKKRKIFAVQNRDKETVHTANNKLIKLNKELKKES